MPGHGGAGLVHAQDGIVHCGHELVGVLGTPISEGPYKYLQLLTPEERRDPCALLVGTVTFPA